MSLDMTHDDVQAALAAEALGALDGGERGRVHAHLATCPECRAELDALREAAALLAHTVPHRPLEPARSDRLRARLLARAAADRQAAPQVISLASRRRSPLPAWLAAAASLLLAVGLGVYASTLRGRVASLQDRNAALSSTLERRESTLAALAGPEVRVVELASTQQREPAGRMFWNPHRRRYTFYAYNLPPVREGREYQLWLITPDGPVAAPTFRRGENGGGSVEGGYDIPNEQIRAFAVTDEPVGGLPKPTGEVVIAGTTTE
ncbi:MAG: hypothetical protein AVDCRST_MAG68-623 [uncultured Gemmatimonadetes bacterium]|uniref:Regulator of SigK n=1 Tax=uncultured Gemmatimonadota bacterium TaxID=203437 RepID=A0A6J4KEV9_9BACT|nr:MAG: hypothetical protein AVDCRST_MAG68-623 [uncultured Gemmatimonadota bacterium]